MESKLANIKRKEIHDNVPPNYYDQVLSKRDIQYYWHKKRFETITAMIPKINGRVLDIGCNGGTFSEVIRMAVGKADLVGVDINKQSVKYAAQKNNDIMFMVADGQRLPFRNRSFNLITCIETLEHVLRPEFILRETNRCLQKEGQIVLLVPNSESFLFRIIWHFWTKFGKGRVWEEAHLNEFGEETLLALIAKFGFKLVEKNRILLGMLITMKARKTRLLYSKQEERDPSKDCL